MDITAHGQGGPATPFVVGDLAKPALRAALRARRDAFVADGAAPGLLAAPPAALVDLLGQAETVAGYVPLGSEADPRPLFAHARAVALPVVTSRADPIRFALWRPHDPLVPGPLGLRQPAPDAPTVDPDLVLVPMLGFDATLARIGQGAGHYDRALAALPAARRIGVAWSAQMCDRLATDPWDMPLHAVLTEREWITA